MAKRKSRDTKKDSRKLPLILKIVMGAGKSPKKDGKKRNFSKKKKA